VFYAKTHRADYVQGALPKGALTLYKTNASATRPMVSSKRFTLQILHDANAEKNNSKKSLCHQCKSLQIHKEHKQKSFP